MDKVWRKMGDIFSTWQKNSPNLFWAPFGQEYAHRPAWGRWQRLYVRLFGLVDLPSRLRARVIEKEIRHVQPQKIMDMGFGVGSYSFYLSRWPQIEVSGLETDAQRVIEAGHIAGHLQRGNIKFIQGTLEDGKEHFPLESFEMVLVVEVLQYLSDLEATLTQIYKLLKPGGYLLGHVPALGYLRPKEKNLFYDEKFPQVLSKVNFQIIKMVPTFGGAIQELCAIYQAISRWPILVGMVFPWLLLISTAFPIENFKGRYRLFLAQKPIERVQGFKGSRVQGLASE